MASAADDKSKTVTNVTNDKKYRCVFEAAKNQLTETPIPIFASEFPQIVYLTLTAPKRTQCEVTLDKTGRRTYVDFHQAKMCEDSGDPQSRVWLQV